MSGSRFHARHEGLFQAAILDRKRLLFIGAGSVGSYLAELLVRSGVLNLHVVDMDTVSETNLCRTVYVESDIGKPKVEALARHLRTIRKNVNIESTKVDLQTVEDATLSTWIESSDLVVSVTDHPPTQSRMAALSYHRTPAVFSGVYAKGTGGEVLFTLPNETPCYHCVLGNIRAEHRPDRGKLDYGLSTGQLAAEPALGIDILRVTTCAAKVALALLLRGTGSPVADVLDPARSVLFVGNAVDWIWQAPFETVWARAERRNSCICRLAPGDSTARLLDEADELEARGKSVPC